MRKPIVELVVRYLLLLGAVGAHPPEVHPAGAVGVEVNPLAVGRIIGAVVQAPCRREPRLRAAAGRDAVNVELPMAFRAVRQRPAIGRPAVPVRRTALGDPLWRAPVDGQRVDA